MSAKFPTTIFAKLSTLIGEEVDLEKLALRVDFEIERSDGDQMAALVSTAKAMNVTITPLKVSLMEALWKAADDCPVVFWNKNLQDWCLVNKAGFFTARLIEGETGEERRTMFRTSFQKWLGHQSLDSVIEVGVVQPSLPMQKSSSNDDLARNIEMQSRSAKANHVHDDGHHAHMSPITRYLRTLMEDKQDILTLLIFSLIAGVLYLAVPLAVDTVVSNLAYGAQNRPYFQALVILGQVVMFSLALQACITGFQYYVSDVIQRRIFARTTADIAFRLPRVKLSSLGDVHAPELVNRFLEVVTIQKNSALFLLDGVNMVIAIFVGMILLSLYHPFLLVFVIILLAVILLVVWVGGRGAIKSSIQESKTKYNLMNWFEEVAAFSVLFKGPGGYDLATMRANQLATDYVNARSAHFNIVIRQVTGLLVVSVVAAVLLLIGGAWLVISQQITLGQLVASEIIMSSIIASLSKFGKKLEAWYDTMAAMDKLGHIFDIEMERNDGGRMETSKSPGGYSVSAENVCFSFPQVGRVLDHLSFSIPAGSNTAVLGTFGSGVSSLFDLIFGARSLEAGSISINDVDIRHWSLESLRKRVLLLRNDQILDTSVIENLRLGRHDIGLDEVHQALKKVGLLGFFLKHPEGLKQRLQISGKSLSKNKRVALLIARAIVQKPRLLMVDELFDGLNETAFRELSEPILSNCENCTVLVSTRVKENAKHFSHLIDLTHNANV